MELSISIKGRQSFITFNGKQSEMKTAFLKSFKVKDLLQYLTDKSNVR